MPQSALEEMTFQWQITIIDIYIYIFTLYEYSTYGAVCRAILTMIILLRKTFMVWFDRTTHTRTHAHIHMYVRAWLVTDKLL